MIYSFCQLTYISIGCHAEFVVKFGHGKLMFYRGKEVTIPANEVIRYTLLYPNEPQDIETLIVDPTSNEIYLVQKNWFGTRAAIYKV